VKKKGDFGEANPHGAEEKRERQKYIASVEVLAWWWWWWRGSHNLSQGVFKGVLKEKGDMDMPNLTGENEYQYNSSLTHAVVGESNICSIMILQAKQPKLVRDLLGAGGRVLKHLSFKKIRHRDEILERLRHFQTWARKE
jgi:hypothetical protein